MDDIEFITAKVDTGDPLDQLRQGWMVNLTHLVGESGTVYPIISDTLTVVTNPPKHPSSDALAAIKGLKETER